ncbi:MAG TPA: hypothetical protein VGP82_11100, partial [Ktedonobacterales bacterium]|nr:hypothetical protein [Ktedonobacterales bacterium]
MEPVAPEVNTLSVHDGMHGAVQEEGLLPSPHSPALSTVASNSRDLQPSAQPPPSWAPSKDRGDEIILPGNEHWIVVPGTGLGNNYVRRRVPNLRETK